MILRTPSMVWVFLVPATLLVSWAAAEWLRRRRIRRFVDPDLMGIRHGMGRRLPSLALLLAAGASISAILSFPRPSSGVVRAAAGQIAILLDSRLVSSGTFPDPLAESADSIRSLLADAPDRDIALFRSGNPARRLIPPTRDSRGFLLRLEAVLQEWQPEETLSVQRLASFPAGRPANLDRSFWIIYTSEPRILLAALGSQPPGSMPSVRVVGVGIRETEAAGAAPLEWIQADDYLALRRLMTEQPAPKSEDTIDSTRVQWLAAMALLALVIEWLPLGTNQKDRSH